MSLSLGLRERPVGGAVHGPAWQVERPVVRVPVYRCLGDACRLAGGRSVSVMDYNEIQYFI